MDLKVYMTHKEPSKEFFNEIEMQEWVKNDTEIEYRISVDELNEKQKKLIKKELGLVTENYDYIILYWGVNNDTKRNGITNAKQRWKS